MLFELLTLGGLLYAGRKALPARLRGKDKERGPAAALPAPEPERSRRELQWSAAALGLAVAGASLGWPWLRLLSLPPLLWVSVPLYGEAWRAVRRRRIDPEVLDAARVTVCVAMGYSVVATLDVWLQSVGRRQMLRVEQEFRATLDEALGRPARTAWVWRDGCEVETAPAELGPGAVVVLGAGDVAPAAGVVVDGRARVRPGLADAPAPELGRGARVAAGSLVLSGRLYLALEEAPAERPDLRADLERAALAETALQRLGERNGEKMAPWMLGAFVFGTPFLGINRAAVFLTTRFGVQMRRLGPHAARHAIGQGVRHGMFIRDVRALELAGLVNTVVIDAEVLQDPAVRSHAAGLVQALRQRPWPAAEALSRRFAVHVLASGEEEGRRLTLELGLDDYFVETSEWGRVALIQRLQQAGRCICYVGRGQAGRDATVLRAAMLGVAHCPGGLADEVPARVVLADAELRGLLRLFELATAFSARQGMNLFTQLGVDVLDVSTTVFLNFGLFYSVLMSHAGLLSSAAGSGFPRPRLVPREREAAETAVEPLIGRDVR